jgi:hypothetical protein
MSVVADSRRVKPLTKNKIILLVLVLVIDTITITPQNSFCYYTPTYLVDVVQRSDFFIFYFSFFILEGSFIIFIGLLITVVTLIILFFTFKNQITAAGGVKKTATMSWVRIQDTQVQNSQKRSFVFFRI